MTSYAAQLPNVSHPFPADPWFNGQAVPLRATFFWYAFSEFMQFPHTIKFETFQDIFAVDDEALVRASAGMDLS